MLRYPGRSQGRDKSLVLRSEPLEGVQPSRAGARLWAGHRLAEEAEQDRVSVPGAGSRDPGAERDGGGHECGGPWSRRSVCLEACSDWGGEAWQAQGGEHLLAPDPEPWQLTWAGVEVLKGPMSTSTGCGCSRWSTEGPSGGPVAAKVGAARCGTCKAAGHRGLVSPCPPTDAFCRRWSCGAYGRRKLVWWPVCDASAAWCAAGSPRTSATSGASWTNTMCV